jgi:hypothetical protein
VWWRVVFVFVVVVVVVRECWRRRIYAVLDA